MRSGTARRRRCYGARIALTLVPSIVFTGCSISGTTSQSPMPALHPIATMTVATTATRIVTPIATPLVPLTPKAGWQEVLRLGTTNGVQMSGGSFVAQSVYDILLRCSGVGHLNVEFSSPKGSDTIGCLPQSQLYSVPEQQSQAGQQVTVHVSSDGNVQWDGIVEVSKV